MREKSWGLRDRDRGSCLGGGGPVAGSCLGTLGPAACALPLPLWPPALFSGNIRIKVGGVRCLSRLLVSLPRPPQPQLCARVTFSVRDGIRKNVCREWFLRCTWTSRLGADGFHLGGRPPDGSLQEAVWEVVWRWRPLCLRSGLQSASPTHPLGLWRLFVQEPQWVTGDSGSWEVEETKTLLL